MALIFLIINTHQQPVLWQFLKQPVYGIPFSLKIEMPNEVTAAAIEEGRRIAADKNIKGYANTKDLRAAL